MEPSAKIIKDSISPTGIRLTTLELVMHRFVLAEKNTHRALSRNSASSRAIPVEKQLNRVVSFPAWPLVWPAEQAGMQGGEDLTGADLRDAWELFEDVHGYTTERVERYLKEHVSKETRVHKSLINRLLEPFMWHVVVVTATQWQNFFNQRVSPLAQPEMKAAATAMLHAMEASEPDEVMFGEYHLPYMSDVDLKECEERDIDPRTVSVARCARVSYLTQAGVRDLDEDVSLYNRLVSARPMHASPLEHVATPTEEYAMSGGNFKGWTQFRHQVEWEQGYDSKS